MTKVYGFPRLKRGTAFSVKMHGSVTKVCKEVANTIRLYETVAPILFITIAMIIQDCHKEARLGISPGYYEHGLGLLS